MDISIDHTYGTKPRASISQRLGRRALMLIAWTLGLLLVVLTLGAATLSGCAYMQCWTL